MNRFFSYTLALVALLFSAYELVFLMLGHFSYNIRFEWLTETILMEILFGIFILSILTLISFGGGSKKEKQLVYVTTKTDHGDTNISKSVFEELASRVLKGQKQVSSFNVTLKANENNVDIHISITPNLEQEGSFVDLTKVISEEVKLLVLNTTSIEVGDMRFTFEPAAEKLVKKN